MSISPKLCCRALHGVNNAVFSAGWDCRRPTEMNSPACEALLPDLLNGGLGDNWGLGDNRGLGDLEGLLWGRIVGGGVLEFDFLWKLFPDPDSVSDGVSRISSGVHFTEGDPSHGGTGTDIGQTDLLVKGRYSYKPGYLDPRLSLNFSAGWDASHLENWELLKIPAKSNELSDLYSNPKKTKP